MLKVMEFFGFGASSTMPSQQSLDQEDDDEDYDALNDETFGESSLNTDWEENHEKLAAELKCNSRRSFDDESGELSERIASYILDDELEEDLHKPLTESSRPNASSIGTNPNHYWTPTNNIHLKEAAGIKPPHVSMYTLEEVERSLHDNLLKRDTTRDLVPNQEIGLRLEDVEKKLKSNAIHPSPAPSLWKSKPPKILHYTGIQRRHPIAGHVEQVIVEGSDGKPKTIFVPSCAQFHGFDRYDGSRIDHYAGLMSHQEKQWLASIQMIQLSTNRPFQDDYYYQMSLNRQQGKCGLKMGSNVMKSNRTEAVMTKRIYTPLQFENSLGKLQVGSVTAPRKIIDMEVVESVESASQNSSRKFKAMLLEIESLYSKVLSVEEFHSPHMGSSSTINPIELMTQVNNALLQNNKLISIMAIKKGKTLVLRALPHLTNPGPIIQRIILDIVAVARNDPEQTLLRYLPTIRIWLSSALLAQLVQMASSFDSNKLSFLLTNKFAVSVLANMIERAENLISSLKENNNDCTLWILKMNDLIINSQEVTAIERPVVGVNGYTLSKHLKRTVDVAISSYPFKTYDLSKLQRALSNLQTSDIEFKQ